MVRMRKWEFTIYSVQRFIMVNDIFENEKCLVQSQKMECGDILDVIYKYKYAGNDVYL